MKTASLTILALLAAPALAAETGATAPTSSISAPSASTEWNSFSIGGGAVKGKLTGYVQLWGVSNQVETPADQGFRLRRAEIKLNGSIANAPKYFLMVDPAKLIRPPGAAQAPRSSALFQDFGLSYAFVPGLELTAGQFKIPTMAEGLDSSGELLLPERSLAGRTFGDKRELGARLSYRSDRWNAASMLSMARPISVDGSSNLQDLHSRVELTPAKEWGVGAFLTLNRGSYEQKGRYGLNARYGDSRFIGRAELAQGRDRGVQSRGLNLEAGYFITESLQPVARFETFQPNQSTVTTARAETLGLNYLIARQAAKVQVAGSFLQEMVAGNGTPVYAKGRTDQVLTVAFQAGI
jgi:hypothetical protein